MVAPALIGALVGAGYGALTYEQDKKRADELRKANATIESTSPWTGVHGKVVGGPSLMGNVASGALTGASFGMQDAFNGKKDVAAAAPQKATEVSYGSAPAEGMAPDPGTAGSSVTRPANYVEQAAQNGPPQPYQQYGAPGAQGYSPWAAMQYGQRPPYRAPGT